MLVTKNATMNAGYYHTDMIEPIPLEHTYAFIDAFGEKYAFPCGGGTALYEGEHKKISVQYPTDIWSWAIFTFACKNLGTNRLANLWMAVAMAQFTDNPILPIFKLSEWEKYWAKGVQDDNFLCRAGIEYGIDGVCHQICNRVITAACFPDVIEVWPPSFNLSRQLYGAHGGLTWEIIALPFMNKLAQKAKSLGQAINTLEVSEKEITEIANHSAPTMEKELQATYDNVLKKSLQTKSDDEFEAQSWQTLSSQTTEQVMNEIVKPTDVDTQLLGKIDAQMKNLKKELDILLIRGEVSQNEYASKVNLIVSEALDQYRKHIHPDFLKQIFPNLGDEQVQIIDPNLLRDSYEDLQKRLNV